MRFLKQPKQLLFNLYFKKTNLLVFLYTVFRYITAPLEEVEKWVPKTGRILDFGCGHGIFSYLLYFSSGRREIVGLDIDRRRIDIANRINPANRNIVFANRSIDTFKEKEFDVVAVIDVLYLMPFSEQENLLKNIYNILKDGGILLIKTMDPRLKFKFLWNFIQEFIAVKIIRITKARNRKLHFIKNINHFKGLLREIGFRTEEIKLDKGFLHPHILLLCYRKHYSEKA